MLLMAQKDMTWPLLQRSICVIPAQDDVICLHGIIFLYGRRGVTCDHQGGAQGSKQQIAMLCLFSCLYFALQDAVPTDTVACLQARS